MRKNIEGETENIWVRENNNNNNKNARVDE